MSINTDETRSTLNRLIETLKDGQEGFRAAAEKLENPEIREQFRSFSQRRSRSDHAIFEEAEAGEDAAVKNCRQALSKPLTNDIRAIVETHPYEVLHTHNIVRNLRDSSRPMTHASGGGGTPAC